MGRGGIIGAAGREGPSPSADAPGMRQRVGEGGWVLSFVESFDDQISPVSG